MCKAETVLGHLKNRSIFMKKVIGIVPKGKLWKMEESNFSDVYEVGNNYCKRVLEASAIPVAVTPVDGRLSQNDHHTDKESEADKNGRVP